MAHHQPSSHSTARACGTPAASVCATIRTPAKPFERGTRERAATEAGERGARGAPVQSLTGRHARANASRARSSIVLRATSAHASLLSGAASALARRAAARVRHAFAACTRAARTEGGGKQL